MVKLILALVLIAGLVFFLLPKKPLEIIKPVFLEGKNIITKPEKPSYIEKIPEIDQIFSPGHNQISSFPKEKLRTIIATGDIIPARSVNFQANIRKDFKWPYLETAQILKSADITFINLETPLFPNCPLTNEGMIFCGDAGNLEGLKYSGVDIASLANNHAGNFGKEGVQKTYDLLVKNRVLVTGVNGPVVMDIRGLKFAFLGYNDITKPQPGISNADEEKIKSEILKAKKIADVVIVAFHWGVEYQDQPDERQKYLARFAIDAGADLIIGNHPHWIQPVEVYKNKLITYAHGNFIFDQEWSLKTKQGVVGKYTFYDKTLIDAEFFPIQIEDFGQPHFLEGEEKIKILEAMKVQSQNLVK